MNSKYILKFYFLLLCLLFSGTAVAEDESEPNPGGGLETFFGISLVGGVTETNLLNSKFQRVDKKHDFLEANIEIQLRWKGLFYESPGQSQENIDGLFSGDAIGYNFYNSRHWGGDVYAVSAFSDGEFTFRTPDETLVLERERNYRLGIRATGYYSDYLAQFIATPVSFQDDIGGVNASFSVRRTWLAKNWNLYATLGFNYQSEEIVDYYWGLSEIESAEVKRVLKNPSAPFEPYRASGGVFTTAEIGFEYPISEHFVFGGFVSFVQRPNTVNDSPLVSNGRIVSTAALSLTYVF